MHQENKMLLRHCLSRQHFVPRKEEKKTSANTHQWFCVRVHAQKERCFDENGLAGLFMALGKSVEDSTNLPPAPCDWLKFATGCKASTHSRKATAVYLEYSSTGRQSLPVSISGTSSFWSYLKKKKQKILIKKTKDIDKKNHHLSQFYTLSVVNIYILHIHIPLMLLKLHASLPYALKCPLFWRRHMKICLTRDQRIVWHGDKCFTCIWDSFSIPPQICFFTLFLSLLSRTCSLAGRSDESSTRSCHASTTGAPSSF